VNDVWDNIHGGLEQADVDYEDRKNISSLVTLMVQSLLSLFINGMTILVKSCYIFRDGSFTIEPSIFWPNSVYPL
jgi:hypothetical protein